MTYERPPSNYPPDVDLVEIGVDEDPYDQYEHFEVDEEIFDEDHEVEDGEPI